MNPSWHQCMGFSLGPGGHSWSLSESGKWFSSFSGAPRAQDGYVWSQQGLSLSQRSGRMKRFSGHAHTCTIYHER